MQEEIKSPYRPIAEESERDQLAVLAAAKKVQATPAATAATGDKKTRNRLGDAGWLQKEILAVCKLWWDGSLPLGEKDTGKPFTPHRIANAIESRGHTRPSSGAVASCLNRWSEYGFANINNSPVSFVSFTELAETTTLAEVVAAHRTKAWEVKNAEKAAAKAAKAAAEATPT